MKKINLFKSRKASSMTEGLNDAISYIILTLVILIFLVIFVIYFKGCGTKNPINDNLLSAKNVDLKTEATLMNLLRTPMAEGSIITVGDGIVFWASKDYPNAAIKSFVKDVLDKTYDKSKCTSTASSPGYVSETTGAGDEKDCRWGFIVEYTGKKIEVYSDSSAYSSGLTQSIQQIIPVPGAGFVKVTLELYGDYE